MSMNFFAYISRMRYIIRWSLMRNSITENIQEHSHMVAVIAHALASIRSEIFGAACDADKCASVALFHDCSEILTGDLPTPIKYYNAEIKNAYSQLERYACKKLVSTLPEKLQASYASLLYGETAQEYHELVKAADKLSAYIKCIEERRAGNDEFLSAERQTRAILEASELPEVRYFLDNFIPAFELTVDELGSLQGLEQ